MPLSEWVLDEDVSPLEVWEIPSGWKAFVERYVGELEGGESMLGVLATVAASFPRTAMVERDYVDRDFRDEFVGYYAQTFRPIPDRCLRLHFLDRAAGRYYGYSILRPVIGRPICRTMLAPPPTLDPYVSCKVSSRASPHGYRFSVEGFPFISQDYQYGVCAHAAIWMVALYFHLHFRYPRFYVSDINRAAEAHHEIGRMLPSEGLTNRQISAVLDDFGMPAINYRFDYDDALPPGETPESIACRYLNSRLPVILLGRRDGRLHACVLIGYGRDQQTDELFFVCHDDAKGPYRAIQELRESGWDRLVVPVPGKIYLAGEAAEKAASVIFTDELEREMPKLFEQYRKDELRLRTYAVRVDDYKHGLAARNLPADIVSFHRRISTSQWLWVTELQDRAAARTGRTCVIGEIAIDPTSDDRSPHLLFANLPGRVMHWPEHGAPGRSFPRSKVDLYDSGVAIHD